MSAPSMDTPDLSPGDALDMELYGIFGEPFDGVLWALRDADIGAVAELLGWEQVGSLTRFGTFHPMGRAIVHERPVFAPRRGQNDG